MSTTFTPTGIKPLNAKVLDGGASWKDRYRVADGLANKIEYCVTYSQGNKEFCFIVALTPIQEQDLYVGIQKFPVGSIIIYRNSSESFFEKRIKTPDNRWTVINFSS